MYYLKTIVENLKRAQDNTRQMVIDEVQKKDREAWIRNTIRSRWLVGKRPDGKLIGVYRSYGYAVEKHQMNPMAGFDHVDLTLTGSLGKGIKVSLFSSTEFEIYSTDSKYLSISETFGDVNFNLSEVEYDTFFAMVADYVVNKQIQQIYGK